MTTNESEAQWVSFSIGREKFACKIRKIQEVIPYEEPIPVPGAPDEIEGVLNVRGEIIPIISGFQVAIGSTNSANATCFDAEQRNTQENSSIIIMEADTGQIGMTIDSVNDIIHIQPSEIHYEESQNSCVTGSILHQEDLIILLEIEPKKFQSQSYA